MELWRIFHFDLFSVFIFRKRKIENRIKKQNMKREVHTGSAYECHDFSISSPRQYELTVTYIN